MKRRPSALLAEIEKRLGKYSRFRILNLESAVSEFEFEGQIFKILNFIFVLFQPTVLMDVASSRPPTGRDFRLVLPLIYLPTPWAFQLNQLIPHMHPHLIKLT